MKGLSLADVIELNAEKLFDEMLSIPMYYSLTDKQQTKVIKTINEWVK